MISKDEIERIKLEEQLRAEIRNNVNQTEKNGLWYYLNSSFGLWFLSTIAVGLLSYGYSIWRENLDETKLRNDQINKLDLEIEARIYQLYSLKMRFDDSLAIFSDTSSYHETSHIIGFWREFKQSPVYSEYGFHSIYHEFEVRTTPSLIVELSSLINDEGEKEELKTITRKIISNEVIKIGIRIDEEKNELVKIVDELRIDSRSICLRDKDPWRNLAIYQHDSQAIRPTCKSFPRLIKDGFGKS